MKEIKKIKITKIQSAEVDFIMSSGKENETYSFTSSAKIHDDFGKAMQDLTPFFIAMTEQGCEENKIKITGITIGGHDENEGATIVGQRMLQGNRVLNLVAPFTKYADMPLGLVGAIILALEEAEFYLNGKKADDPQTQLDLQ